MYYYPKKPRNNFCEFDDFDYINWKYSEFNRQPPERISYYGAVDTLNILFERGFILESIDKVMKLSGK